jgi:hypothetical protein
MFHCSSLQNELHTCCQNKYGSPIKNQQSPKVILIKLVEVNFKEPILVDKVELVFV